jgi:hypothetical protein
VPVAGVSVAIPVANISYILMTVSAYADTTGRFKYVVDSAVVEDLSVISFAKAVADSVSMDDSHPILNVNKGLTDSVGVSDDFIATLVFIRNFADTVGLTDAAAFALLKNLADSVSVTDTDVYSLSKLILDGVAMNDSFDATDGAEWAFTKGVSNVVLMSDAQARQVAKAVSDTLTLIDSVIFSVEKPLQDTATATDAESYSLAKALTDTATITDLEAFLFEQGARSDSISVSDTSTRSPGKGLSESASTADAGYLYSQGYCDLTYFAGDYVGAYRTF